MNFHWIESIFDSLNFLHSLSPGHLKQDILMQITGVYNIVNIIERLLEYTVVNSENIVGMF